MAIHENLAKVPKQRLKEMGWRKAPWEVMKVAGENDSQTPLSISLACYWRRRR